MMTPYALQRGQRAETMAGQRVGDGEGGGELTL